MRDSAFMPKLRQNSGVSGVHSHAPLSSPFVSSSSEAAMAIMNNSCETSSGVARGGQGGTIVSGRRVEGAPK